MVGMRMVIAHHVGARGAGLLVGLQHRLRLDHVAVVPAVLPLVVHREKALDGRGVPGGAADQEAAALLREGRLAVAADRLQVAGFDDETAHQISSSQNRSDRYLSALSHRTVTTVPARSRAATLRAAATLHPEEMPASRPVSRASRFTIR